MKKIIICLTFFLGTLNYVIAQTADAVTSNKYYYYPTQDAYYDVATGNYLYHDVPTSSWIAVNSLPSSYVINDKTERFEILYEGTDVWKDHKKHTKIYKVKRNGQVVVRANRFD